MNARLAIRPSLDHPWRVPRREAMAIQDRLAGEVVLCAIEADLPGMRVAGVDVAYSLDGDRAWAAAVVTDAGGSVLEQVVVTGEPDMPYMRGFLGFREGRITLEALESLSEAPDVVFFDGHGVVHERGLGLASHVGVLLDVASVGVPKTPFHSIDHDPGPNRGDFYVLTKEWGAQGAAIRLKDRSRPVYVSPGHHCDLDSAIACAMAWSTGRRRVPDALAEAHTASVRARNEAGGRF